MTTRRHVPEPAVHGTLDEEGRWIEDPWTAIAEHLPSCPRHAQRFVRMALPYGPQAGRYGGICRDCGAAVIEIGDDVQPVRDPLLEARRRADGARQLLAKREHDAAYASAVAAAIKEAETLESKAGLKPPMVTREAIETATAKLRRDRIDPTVERVAKECHTSERTLYRMKSALGIDRWPWQKPTAGR